MADKKIGIQLDMKSTGLQQVDDIMNSISKNAKNLNQSIMNRQQKGWGTESQTKELREQVRLMNQMLDSAERIARSKGVRSDSFNSFRQEFSTMNRDLTNLQTYRNPISGHIQQRFGQTAANTFDKALDYGSRGVSALAAFDLFGTLKSGMNTGTQMIYGYGDLAKRMAPNVPSAIQWGQNLSNNLQGYGYDDMTIMQNATQYAGATGRMDSSAFTKQMQAIEQVGRAYGLDLSSVTQNFSAAYQNGVTGGSGAQMSPQEYANLVANAVNRGNMQGREAQVMEQMQQLIQLGVSTTGQAGNSTQITGLLDNVYQSKNQALINQAPQFFQGIDNGMMNPGGGMAGQMLMLGAISSQHKLSYWQQQYVMQSDAFTPLDELGGKTKFETALPQLYKDTKGEDPDQQAVLMGQILGVNPSLLKQYLPMLMNSDDTVNTDAENKLKQQLGNSTSVQQNDADKVRNQNQSKDHAANNQGMNFGAALGNLSGAEGSLIDKFGTPVITGLLGLWATKQVASLWTKGKKTFQRTTGQNEPPEPPDGNTPKPTPNTPKKNNIIKFPENKVPKPNPKLGIKGVLGELGTWGEIIGGAMTIGDSFNKFTDWSSDYIFGHVKGQYHLGGAKYQDSRDPIWIRWLKKQNAPASGDSGQISMGASAFTPTSYNLATGGLPTAADGSQLAPIVASTIVALGPYMSQLKPYLDGTGTGSSAQNDLLNKVNGQNSPSLNALIQRPNASSASPWGNLMSLSNPVGSSTGMMPIGSGGSYSGSAVDAVNYWSQQYGVPAYIGQSIAMAESTMNPDADVIDINGQHSTGLFQLNQAGQGAGHSVNDLKNPMLNAQIGMKAIANAYHQAPAGLSGPDLAEWVAEHSGHPGYGVHSGLDDTIKGYAQQIIGGTINFKPASVTVTVKNGQSQQVTVPLTPEHPTLSAL